MSSGAKKSTVLSCSGRDRPSASHPVDDLISMGATFPVLLGHIANATEVVHSIDSISAVWGGTIHAATDLDVSHAILSCGSLVLRIT